MPDLRRISWSFRRLDLQCDVQFFPRGGKALGRPADAGLQEWWHMQESLDTSKAVPL